MGTFNVSIQIGDLAGQQFVEVQALVDTGSTYTVLPKELLEQLGINQEGHAALNWEMTGWWSIR